MVTKGTWARPKEIQPLGHESRCPRTQKDGGTEHLSGPEEEQTLVHTHHPTCASHLSQGQGKATCRLSSPSHGSCQPRRTVFLT